jgi:hypothetical protein
MEADFASGEAVSLYVDLKPNEQIDLEVAARAAIEWSKMLKAASTAVDPSFKYRVVLIAAEPGSSKWLAKIERSLVNQAAKDVASGWQELPTILKYTVAATAFVVVTGYPTYKTYFGDDGFTPTQLEQRREMLGKTTQDPEVKAHRKAIYTELQQDRNVTAVGGGVPDKPDWRPPEMVPVGRFSEANGFVEAFREPEEDDRRTIFQTLDVILVTPRLVNANLAWTFRQEGIPGQFTAMMKDAKFLAALESSGIHETLRANIPMTIKLEIKEVRVDGKWKVKRRGRSVLEVISPLPDVVELLDHSATLQ